MKTKLFFAAVLGVLGTVQILAGDDSWDAKRQAAINRKRTVIYNTDGCDAVYYPKNLPATKENFINQRLQFTRESEIDSVFYCPLSSGFNNFTAKLESAELLTAVNPEQKDSVRNITQELVDQGTDPLQLAVEYCRSENLEIFVSIRVNDTHDQAGSMENPYYSMPQYKKDNPHLLLGGSGIGEQPPFCLWSAMDFSQPEVRAKMAAFVREFCEKYDIDGIEYDFMRHMQLFKSVAWGGKASAGELELMTDFMLELRKITEEAGKKRGKPILVAIRVPDSVDYCRAVGIDLEKWLAKNALDILITTSYFRLEPWENSIKLAKKYGVKYYGSIDESRVRDVTLNIPKRNSYQSYRARFLELMECGADGIYMFNMEGSALRSLPTADVEKLRKMEKVYYARVLGSNGSLACSYLRNGDDYLKLPTLEPEYPEIISPDRSYEFDMFIADDINTPEMQAKKAIFTAVIGINAPVDAALALHVNGVPCQLKREGRVCSGEIPAGTVKKGNNHFVISLAANSNSKPVIREYLKGDIMPRGKAQGKWRRLFDFNTESGEAVIDGAYTLIDNHHKSSCNFMHPLPKRKGAFDIEFTMKGDKNGDRGTAVVRVVSDRLTETVIFEPEKITFVNAGKSAVFQTADDFHNYQLVSDGKTVKLFADGKELIAGKLFADSSKIEYALSGYAIFVPWMDTDSVLIGSLSKEGKGTSAWKNVRFADALISVDDFALTMTYKKESPEKILTPFINAPRQVIGSAAADNGKVIISDSLKSRYRPNFIKAEGDTVIMDHECFDKYQHIVFKEDDRISRLNKPFVISWKMKELQASEKSDWSFIVGGDIMTASKEFAQLVFRFGKGKIQVPWHREYQIPGNRNDEHSFMIIFDPETAAAGLWVDGNMLGGGFLDTVHKRYGSLYFGDGSGAVYGKISIKDFQISIIDRKYIN